MKAFSVLACAFVLIMATGIYEAWAADAGASAGAVAPAPAAPAAPATQPAAKPAPAKPASVPVEPATAEEAISLVGVIGKLFKDGAYRPAVGAIITLLMFIWRRFASGLLIGKVPAKHLGWFTAALGVLAAIPASLATEPWSWGKFFADALLISGPAVLFWTTLGKTLLPKVFGALPEKKPE